MSTKYSIQNMQDGDWATVDTRSEKDAAIKLADDLHASEGGMVAFQVVTDAGTVVYELTSVDEDEQVKETEEVPVEGGEEGETVTVIRTRPWSRVATPRGFEAPEIEGYTVAYTRSRTKVAIYRADDRSGWLVLDTRDGSQTKHENTKEARFHTNELTAAFTREQAQLKAEAKAAKAKEIADKKAAREAEKAEKEAAKEAAATESTDAA
jgi:hypothetical protein